jgi:hypothetical protein
LRQRSSAGREIARRLPAAALIGLGFAALYGASGLPFGTVRQPDSGFFPTLVSLALIVFSAVALADTAPVSPHAKAVDARAPARIWTVVAAVAAYAWVMPSAGFLVCTAALLVVLLRGIGRVSWPASVAVALLASVVCYGLFTRLGLPLPPGPLAF